MKISVKDEQIELKKTLRSLLLFESITDRPFSVTTTTDVLSYFYCVVLASKPDIELSFEEFIEILDEQPNSLQDFQNWLIKSNEIQGSISKKKTTKAKVKP